tara:strand:+ start:365 stop:1420 length:1056 start_codon:yes stop_codon:yes gene_type:complete
MSDLKINNITDRLGESGPVIAGICTVKSTGAFTVPVGPTEYRGGRGRGLICGGRDNPNYYKTINYVEIATTGNSVDFGELSTALNSPKGTSNTIRACFASGYDDDASAYLNTIQYVTISSQGGASDFGDLITGAEGGFGTASNNTRGLYVGSAPSRYRTCQYITFATTGDANNFGDLLPNWDVTNNGMRNVSTGVLGSSTRAIFAGGDTPSTYYNTIQYTEYASLGDTIKFGELSATWTNTSAVSSGIRGVIMGGENPSITNVMEYITIATFGNGTDFGDLTDARRGGGAFDNSIRGCLAGGDDSGSAGDNSNIIDYITIASTGNATDFGDITYSEVRNPGSGSDVHGGLG